MAFAGVCLPETGHDLAGQGIRPQGGYEADKGDAGVPEFDGFGARFFHGSMVI